MPRTANGRTLPQHNVVAADAVAALAGVCFTSTMKVIAALNTIHAANGVPYADLMDIDSLPMQNAQTADRTEATEAFVNAIVDSKAAAPARSLLQLVRRFSAR